MFQTMAANAPEIDSRDKAADAVAGSIRSRLPPACGAGTQHRSAAPGRAAVGAPRKRCGRLHAALDRGRTDYGRGRREGGG